MDPAQFDDLAKALATPTSRRKALQVLAALAGASGLSALPISLVDGGTLDALAKEAHGEQAIAGTQLTGRLVFPNSPDYDSARLGYALQFNRFPIVIVFCQNVQDVVNALKWCREHNVAFRARSGRHALEGWSSVDGGVIIDVSQMNQIHVDTRAELATVQTGARQGDVVNALGKMGYAIPSGGEVTPGIAGVTLGGGLGWLTRSMGMASDHLVGLEMVIPSGKQGAEVLQVDEHHHADLLWASRGGGGGNFGIATSFTFKIRPLSTVTMYSTKWGPADWDHFSELLSAWQKLAPDADERFGSEFTPFSKKSGTITSQGMFLGSEEARLRQLLQPLLAIGKPDVTIQTMSYLDAWLHFAYPIDPPENDKISSAFVYDSLPPKGIEVVHRFLADAPQAEADVYCLAWGGVMRRIPTDATAFFHRRPRYYIEWDSPWTTETEQRQVIDWVEGFRLAMQPYVQGSYINVPDRDISDYGTAYYGDNFDRLREVKRKYDPEYVFHFEQSIPPA
jgi:FAD binding domain/Berberine and berberine like